MNQTNKIDSSKTGFNFFYFPFGSSFIFIALIGPGTIYGISSIMKKHAGQISKKQLKLPGVSGSSLPNEIMVAPVVYTGIHVLLSSIRGTDDNLNIFTSGALTGAVCKAASGNLNKCMFGAGVGLALASLYCLWKSNTENNNDYNSFYRQEIDKFDCSKRME